MINELVDYYRERKISPVHQDIRDVELHYERRRKLYRQLGIPVAMFGNIRGDILEVGPGGGYNTLAFFHWGAPHIDLVDANDVAIREMENLFSEQGIEKSRYSVFHTPLEGFQSKKTYDIIIAEGFIPLIYNQKEIIDKLKSFTHSGTIVVITCMDYIGSLVEMSKRLIGGLIVKDVSLYQDKVALLTKFFEPQLKTLRGVSRPAEDWVKDQLLNPATLNGPQLRLDTAMEFFGTEYHVLGTSPKMLTDYSWYKDIWTDEFHDNQKEFREKHLSLFLAGIPEIRCEEAISEEIHKLCEQIFFAIRDYEQRAQSDKLKEIGNYLQSLSKKMENICTECSGILWEAKEALNDAMSEDIVISKYPKFFSAFGRSQQYIAFEKK